MIRLRIPGIPRPAGSKRVVTNRKTGKPYVIDACSKSRDWKTTVAQIARDNHDGSPLTQPLSLEIKFVFPRPKSHYGSNGKIKRNAPDWKTTKPDLTKLVRAVEDALTGIVWVDDSQVVATTALKQYADETHEPCTWIEVSAINGDHIN